MVTMGRGLLAAQFRGGLCQEAQRLTYSTCPVSWRRRSPKAFPGDARPPSEPRTEHSKPQRVWWEGRQVALCVACTCPEGPSPWVLRLSVTEAGGQEQRLAGRVLVRAGPDPMTSHPTTGFSVNGQLIGDRAGSPGKPKGTYFGRLGIANPATGFQLEVTPQNITLNPGSGGPVFSWRDQAFLRQNE